MQYVRPAVRRAKKGVNCQYGDLVKVAAEISGRSKWTVYGVLSGRRTSKPIRRAIHEARQRIRGGKRRAA
jgi:hypothetical protein